MREGTKKGTKRVTGREVREAAAKAGKKEPGPDKAEQDKAVNAAGQR